MEKYAINVIPIPRENASWRFHVFAGRAINMPITMPK
jgi:hypothetical protein